MQPREPFDTGVDVGRTEAVLRRAEPGHPGCVRVRPLASARAAGVLLAAFAALVALPSQAQAQTEVWSATLTVRNLGSGTLGCSNFVATSNCSRRLTDHDFTHDSTNYAVEFIFLRSSGYLEIDFDTDLTTATQGLVLNVDGTAFAFEDAAGKTAQFRRWNSAGLSWSAGDSVSLTLTEPDTTPPALSTGHGVDPDGTPIYLIFDEDLKSTNLPPASAFTVTANGATIPVTTVQVGLGGSNTTLVIGLGATIGEDWAVTVSYADPTTGNDANALQDADGNDVASFSDLAVDNQSEVVNSAPMFPSSTADRSVAENTAAGQNVGGVLTATDTDGDTLTYTLEGTDAASFDIVTTADPAAQIRTKTGVTYNYEAQSSYTVVVKADDSNGGTDTVTVTITVTDVTEPPGQPLAPTVMTVSGSSDRLNVVWLAPANTGPDIDNYDLRYREGTSGGWTNGPQNVNGTSATIMGLTANTSYQVQVLATNNEGDSPWSEPGEGMTVTPLTVQMTPDRPPPVEGAFTVRFSFSETVRGFSSSDMETQQDPACTDSTNNPISCNPSIAALQTTDDRIFTTTVTPRTEQVAHNYTLTITVPANTVTSVVGNTPNEAAALDVRTAPPGVTVPISLIGLRANSGNGQVTLRWNAPANNGGAPIVRYEYRFAAAGEDFSVWENVPAGTRRVTVGGLINGTEYVFEVRPANALGYGSVETAMATPEEGGVIIFPPPPPPPVASNFPTADAGPDQTGVWEGALVMLDGSGSSHPDGELLRFRWNQFSGEPVVLSSRDIVNPTFTAPQGLTADAVLSFRLLVTDPEGRFDSDTVTVTVDPEAEPPLAIYYFPHLAVGAGWQTTVTYINYSPQEVNCTTDFISDQGTPLMVSFAGLGTVVSRNDVLPPGGSVHQETNVELSAPLAPGWARATCSGPVKASLLFRQHNSEGVPVAEAGVSAAAVPATRFVTFAEQGEGQYGTGVAYANPSDTEALVTFTARDADGEVLASVNQDLPAGGHAAQNMEGLFDLTSFAGSLEITSTEPIVALSLNFEAAPVFSSLPPGEVDAAAQGSTTYYFPHLAVGASWQTTVTYINYSPQEVSCRTEFLSDHGSPLMVSFPDQGTVISRPDTLPPGGSVHQQTNVELSAPLAPGWARATCTGPVKASLLFRGYDSAGMPTGEAGVNATTVPSTRFVTFAEQGEGQSGTGVAYANPSATAALVTFTARDADGEVLASVDETLLPNGHDAQNMVDLFGLGSFSGSLEVTSTAPIVSLSLNNEADPVFSSLPPGEVDGTR